ncbi:MAG TPA: ComEC/Rec2 family competence protein [Dehalococcoidia bacterium]|nr:ComEC/Rec2 family competence protein [Dehalococcoidia bacterium]
MAACWVLAAVAVAWRPRWLPLTVLAAVLAFTAAWRYDATLPRPASSPLMPYVGTGTVALRGVVDGAPEETGGLARYTLSVREVQAEAGGPWRAASGRVLLTAFPQPSYRYGDLLEAEGELRPPPSPPGFDYRAHLSRRGIVALSDFPRLRLLAQGEGSGVAATLIGWRERLAEALQRSLPEPQASLSEGVLLGRRAALPAELRAAMDAAGLSHLLAVSGQNVALLAGLAVGGLSWALGRRWAAVVAVATVVAYAVLVGGQPPVVRAAIMSALFLVARMVGRPGGGLQPLLLAAAVIAHDPQVVHDLSFQLSFASTLGLVALSPSLAAWGEAWLTRLGPAVHALLRPAVEVLALTLAAVALVLPISALAFGRASLAAPLANLAAAPAFIASLVGSATVALAGTLWPPLGDWLWPLAWVPAAYLTAVARAFGALPVASLSLDGFGLGHAFAYYALLGLGTWAVARWRPELPQRPPLASWALAVVLLAPMTVLALWLTAAQSTPSGHLQVTFLDVGEGNAVLVTTPAGRRVLIDGGPDGQAVVAALSRHLRPWEGRIDLVVLTYPRAGRLAGLLEVLDRYHVAQVLAPPVGGGTALFRAWQDALWREGADVAYGSAGHRLVLDGAVLEVLSPEGPPLTTPSDPRPWALVLRLTLGQVSFLFPSDAPVRVQERLAAERLPLAGPVLYLPGNGARGSLSPLLVSAAAPWVTVLSVGEDNRYGHPSAEVLEMVSGTPLLRTDTHGDVTFETDGRRLQVRTAR